MIYYIININIIMIIILGIRSADHRPPPMI